MDNEAALEKKLLEVHVTLNRPGEDKPHVIYSCVAIRAAERFIALREAWDPEGVRRGDYGIDASERAEAEYQRCYGR